MKKIHLNFGDEGTVHSCRKQRNAKMIIKYRVKNFKTKVESDWMPRLNGDLTPKKINSDIRELEPFAMKKEVKMTIKKSNGDEK